MTVRCHYQATCDKCGKTLQFWALGPEMLDILEANGWTHERPQAVGELITKCPNCKRKKREEEMDDKKTIEDTLLHPGVVDEEEETEKEEEE